MNSFSRVLCCLFKGKKYPKGAEYPCPVLMLFRYEILVARRCMLLSVYWATEGGKQAPCNMVRVKRRNSW